MLETEIEVPSIKEANGLLEALGYSYKSYQEKERITYSFENYEIDIDTWPGLPTYFEIEGNFKCKPHGVSGYLDCAEKKVIYISREDYTNMKDMLTGEILYETEQYLMLGDDLK